MGGFILLYKPPCGAWYVHSHRIYGSAEQALEKASKFLPVGTTISLIPISSEDVARNECEVL